MDPAVRFLVPFVTEGFHKLGINPYVPLLDLPNDDPALPYIVTSWLLYVIGGMSIYFILGSLSYFYLFVWNRTKFFPGKQDLPPDDVLSAQVREEIRISLWAFPFMAMYTLPFNYMEYLHMDNHYDNIDEHGMLYFVLSPFLFLLFADTCIYWIHRALHHPVLYKPLHKRHHTYRVTTPFSSHAFHPFDGWLQASPYMLFAFIFPFHKVLHLVLFIAVNIWTVSIHDRAPVLANSFLNSSDHHDVHHRDFIYNYGQYFCFWDRVCGTYKNPHYLFKDRSIKGSHRIRIPGF